MSAASAFLRDVILSLPADAPALLSVPAPLVAPEQVLALGPEGPAFLWAPPTLNTEEGPTLVGLGAAALLAPVGPRRIGALQDQAERLLRGLVQRAAPGTAAVTPRFVGALAFAPGAAAQPPWTAFGDTAFALPRWTYCSQGGAATLSLALLAGDRDVARALAELALLLRGLGEPAQTARPAAALMSSGAAGLIEQDPRSWAAQIDAIRAAIASGDFRKIVAARRSLLPLRAPLAEAAVLCHLRREQPGGTCFALRRGGATFLGSTPERLLRKRGAEVYTEALAGSIPVAPQAERAAALLFASAKDREEHELVVQDLRARLSPLCDHLEAPDAPQVRALRHMLHLLTPVRGHLRRPLHALALVQALHPTPAVGGLPREAALRWIADEEAAPRGLYAGPVGWFDAAGDGEFMVAIRSGLLTPQAAYLYAGAGIIGGSDPDAEYAETGLKQQALLRALRAAAHEVLDRESRSGSAVSDRESRSGSAVADPEGEEARGAL